MTRPPGVEPEEPSRRLVAQRVRNQVIEYLALAASFEEQSEYERRAPIAHIPYEVIEQWQDWVPGDPRDDQDLPDVYDPAEVEAMKQFHDVWLVAVSVVSDDYPTLAEVQAMPEWDRLREAAESAAAVFSRRGKLSDDREGRDLSRRRAPAHRCSRTARAAARCRPGAPARGNQPRPIPVRTT